MTVTNKGTTNSFMKAILPIELIRRMDPSEQLSSNTVLMLLYIMQYPDKSVADLGRLANMPRSATSRHILNLTERGDRARGRAGLGVVEHYEDEFDSRIKRVRLTPKGKSLAADIAKILLV